MYQVSVPLYLKMLGNLSAILDKGAAFAEAKKLDPAVLLGYRLAPDMFNLTKQVQTATDQARRACARLAGVEAPAYEDKEASFAELKLRIDNTVAFIDSLKPAQFEGAETREIQMKSGGVDRVFIGLPYLLHNALPNFFFHATTAYAILRHCGVEIGKRDFLGPL
jgi:hypothetical protein